MSLFQGFPKQLVKFFEDLKKILDKNAVVSFGVSSSENYIGKKEALFVVFN